ncbi:ATP-dependent DNA ligase [Catellatospora coxensis]|uniref:Putative DNA ligase LigC n=2 Tax=Catellatospora coxensis TaxID=310354 RepID=A0A8J3KT14_9ACTN|nr:putative DNA ligase LigC [Catellatospora coxensis]
MQAEPVADLPAPDSCAGGCCYEIKWDGYRCVLFASRTPYLQSRALKPLGPYFPDIVAASQGAFPPGAVVDGELVIWDASADRTSFTLLHRRLTAGRAIARESLRHPAVLVLFDLLHDGDTDLRRRPLWQRRVRLEQLLTDAPPQLQLCPQTCDADEARSWLRHATATGAEGLVVKGRGSAYEPGRRVWRKLRATSTAEAIVGGITGPPGQPATLLLGRLDRNGTLRYVGRTRPLTGAQSREVGALLRVVAELAGPAVHPWPDQLPAAWVGQFSVTEPLPYRQVPPLLVVEVEHDTAWEFGRWRHSSKFHRIRAELLPMQLLRMAGDDWDQPLE